MDLLITDIEKCDLFSGFQHGFRSPRYSVSVVLDRIARSSNGSGATSAVVLGTSKAFDRV